MKKLLALGVAITILIISVATHSILKIMLQSSNFGLNMYDSYGTMGSIIYTLIEMSPLIIGIWLIRFSWKKIIYKEEK